MLARLRKFYKLGVSLSALLAGMQIAEAAVTATPVFVQTPNLGVALSNGATAVTLYTGGTNGSKCSAGWVTNAQSATPYTLTLSIVRSSTTYAQETVNVPANSGNSTTQEAINLFSAANWVGLPIDSDGNPFFYLKGNGDVLSFVGGSAGASTFLAVSVVCADF